MSRSKAQAVVQGIPTQPRPRDAQGLELDQWGLPLCGPARQAALRSLGKPDPELEPDAWTQQADAAEISNLTENGNG